MLRKPAARMAARNARSLRPSRMSLPHRLVRHERFCHGDALGVARVPASRTARSGPGGNAGHAVGGPLLARGGLEEVHIAVRAQSPDQALGEDGREAPGDPERLQAEVLQSGDGGCGVDCVERVRTRCPVKAACPTICATSASRISPTMMTFGSCRSTDRSTRGKCVPRLHVDGGLVHALDVSFDRILDADDVRSAREQGVQRRIERRGLARGRRAREQDEPVGAPERAAQARQRDRIVAEGLQRLEGRVAVHQAHDHLFAVHRGQGQQAVHRWCRPLPSTRKAPSCGRWCSAMLVRRHHLEPVHDERDGVSGNRQHRLEDTADTR